VSLSSESFPESFPSIVLFAHSAAGHTSPARELALLSYFLR
jgi:hypothetical protein